MTKVLVGTGYHPHAKTPIPPQEFLNVWESCVKRNAGSDLARILVVTAGMSDNTSFTQGVTTILGCTGDLGHIRDKHEGRTEWGITGWAAGMLTAALVAYNDGLDFVYQEQDCLAFGQYIAQLKADAGDGIAALGCGLQPPHQKLKSSQSLFYVKHKWIWVFVRDYLMEGEDNCIDKFGEVKFHNLLTKCPDQYRRQTPGWNVDRDRPLPWGKETWAAQQWTEAEYNRALVEGLL